MIRYIHGSSNSSDIDTVYVFDHIPDFSEAKSFCDGKKTENANIICVENGTISYCYKGTVDELNNSLLTTYYLHEQDFPLIITNKVKRDRYLKLVRSTRCITSQLSRTEIRAIIKRGLNGNWNDRRKSLMATVGQLETINVNDVVGKNPAMEIFKTMAFQIGQTLSLFTDGEELYTKNEISSKYPLLRQYLNRCAVSTSDLRAMLYRLIYVVDNEKYTIIGEHGVRFDGNPSITYDIKTEQISIKQDGSLLR